jgi:hypothetical protein
MDILIFNVYRAVGITTKSYKQKLLDFKNKPDLKFCVIFKICNRFKKNSDIISERIYPSPLSSLVYITKLVLLPFPYLMMIKLRWTRIMVEFFLKDKLRISI